MVLRISGGRRLRSPAGLATRPTPARVRLAVMNILAPRLAGSRWLDLCCGSGAMACEALQHGVATVVGVEADRQTADLARSNLAAVAHGLPHRPELRVEIAEVVRWLARGRAPDSRPFEVIYADPPYGADLYEPIARAVMQGGWLAADGLLLLECGRNNQPCCPDGWQARGRARTYGQTCVLVLEPAISPPARCPADTGSRPPRTDPQA
jgi:16S rRNA (guanine966-N2)-methyltransferase